jgi:hypothetical protein
MIPHRRVFGPVNIGGRAHQMLEDPEDQGGPLLPDEWHAVRSAGVNLLIAGPREVTRSVVTALQPQLRQPVIALEAGNMVTLPTEGQALTLVLHDISKLGSSDQDRLLAWLECPATRVQVISTTAKPILPLIEAGGFLASLYYRLNTVCVDVTASG